MNSGKRTCKIFKGKFYAVSVLCESASHPTANTPLIVSQFTLLGKVKKGNKPDFHGAAPADKAKELYEYFYSKVGENYRAERVQNGVFQAMMDVALVNDGPVSASSYYEIKRRWPTILTLLGR